MAWCDYLCKDTDETNHGLCTGLNEDLPTCLLGCVFPCCMAGTTEAMLNDKNDPKFCDCRPACCGWLVTTALIPLAIPAGTSEVLYEGLADSAVTGCITGAYQAGKVRKKRGEPPRGWYTAALDFAVGLVCGYPCQNIKNYRDTRGIVEKQKAEVGDAVKTQKASATGGVVIAQPDSAQETLIL